MKKYNTDSREWDVVATFHAFFWNFFGQKKKKNNMSEHSNLRLGEYTRYIKRSTKQWKKKDSQKLRWQCFGRKNLRLLTFFVSFL